MSDVIKVTSGGIVEANSYKKKTIVPAQLLVRTLRKSLLFPEFSELFRE